MVVDLRMVIGVALILVGIGALLLFLIAWRRKDAARYFQFQLLAYVFLVLVGTLMSLAPRGAALPLWILGITLILTGLFSLAWLVAIRFNLGWLIDALSGGKRALRCSFCGKNQRYVKQLIAGPGTYICDECVEICQRILDEPGEPQPETPAPQPTAT